MSLPDQSPVVLEKLPPEILIQIMDGMAVKTIVNFAKASPIIYSIVKTSRQVWISSSGCEDIPVPTGYTLRSAPVDLLFKYAIRATLPRVVSYRSFCYNPYYHCECPVQVAFGQAIMNALITADETHNFHELWQAPQQILRIQRQDDPTHGLHFPPLQRERLAFRYPDRPHFGHRGVRTIRWCHHNRIDHTSDKLAIVKGRIDDAGRSVTLIICAHP
ncbi:hypothetical protein SISSUDRAFT_1029848 [Sistotremastrum suecicum HHB10207 ss-3]|uniref:F-box domain-containing protein n=1 Tax=Sistotremastrum suecicum HHB10207 ss-3 TaxID=1314776 RepID=A0A166I1M8_9AGAM|nr:hypothetical protein SISSUDRAFT_1029848 [Sistotremastrum suecicum HHB10207 ss-3]